MGQVFHSKGLGLRHGGPSKECQEPNPSTDETQEMHEYVNCCCDTTKIVLKAA